MFLEKCPKCGTANLEKAEFCSRCAANLESELGVLSFPLAASPELPMHPPPALLAEAPKKAAAPTKPTPQAAASQHMFGERYKVNEMLGRGRLGTVYKVYDKAFKRDLALRSIGDGLTADLELCERAVEAFKKERRIIHKNVGWIIDLGAEKGTVYVTMGYTPGQELGRLMKEKLRVPIEKALDLAVQLCSGLAEVHRQGVAHLDLRPGNIMIDKEGRARIMDLGIVKFLRAKELLSPDFLMGMPEYLSPEQIEGKEGDARSDIYSLGLIIYEMVTGRPAFKADTASVIREKHLQESPRNPCLLNPLVSEPLGRLILKCLEKYPGKRYRSAQELLSDLEVVRSGAVYEPAEHPAPLASKKAPAAMEAKTDRPSRKKRRAGLKWDFGKVISKKQILVPALIVIAGAILGIILWRFVIHPSPRSAVLPSSPTRPSIAILPFEDLRAAKGDEYWGEGMADLLIDGLTKINDIFVPGCDSSFSFKGKNTDFRETGLKLGVDYILKADFEKNSDTLRIEAKLIRARDESPVWSMRWDRKPAELLNILEEIGHKVINSLGVNPPQGQKVPLLQESPRNLEAYDLYAEGRSLLRKGDTENLEKAIGRFQKASEKEPRCPVIQTALAEALVMIGTASLWPPEKAFEEAKIQALNALKMAPGLAEAQALIAIVQWKQDWDFAGAEKRFQEALRIKPNSILALRFYAELLSTLGHHEEAVTKINMAKAQDPFSPRIGVQAGAIFYYSRLYDQAIEEANKGVGIDPLNHLNYSCLGMVHVQLGQYNQAVQSFRRAAEFGGDPIDLSLKIAYVHALQKRRREAGKALTEALRNSGQARVSSVSVAAVYAALLEGDQAMTCLKKALIERDPRVLLLKAHPMFDFLQRDAPFIELLRKIGFPN